MALTDAGIRALRPRAGRYMVSDGRGLSLDVLPSGKMSWLYRYCLDGKYGKVNLGRYPDLTLKAARGKRDELAGQVAEGKSPAVEAKQRRAGLSSNPTVREFGERYFTEQVVRNWKDPKSIRRYLDNEILPALGEKALKELNALDVQALVYRKRDSGRIAAAMQLRNVLKQMFDYALELQLVTINPAAMVATRYIGKARKRVRVLTPKEIRLYLHTIYQSNIRRQFKLALHIILLTLSRKSELLLARWEHVNFEAGEWLIPEGNAKTGKPHIVYLSTQVAEMFRELKALAGDSKLVLPGRSSFTRPFAANALNKALEGLTFDMDPLTIHDLRRTGATLLTEHGFNRDVIEKALSHEAEGIRAVYIVAEFAEQRKKMLQWWADYVEGLVNESKVIVGNFGAIA
ncbi:MAG TPA: integrase arm-type DNA-binding domain-containing protein [Terracidiphilus sp.]|nr:integrase arm-type DNA-binding domain-containing protein [Terracidiphilus sp.]